MPHDTRDKKKAGSENENEVNRQTRLDTDQTIVESNREFEVLL